MEKIKTTHAELMEELERQARDARGSDIYIIRALKPVVTSNQLLIQSNEEVKEAIKQFEQSTNKAQKCSYVLVGMSILIAIAQLVLAYVTLKSQGH